MRILFVITSSLDYPYGQGRCAPLARALVAAGHEVSIAALHPALASVSDRSFQDGGVAVHYVGPMHVRQVGDERRYYRPPGLGWAVTRATAGLLLPALLARADVIHVGKPHPMNGLAGLAGQWLRGRRLFVDCDDYEAESNHFGGGWQKRVVAFWEDRLPLRAAGVTTNTRFMQRRLEDLGCPPERIAYVPNGIGPEWLAPLPQPRLDAIRREWAIEDCRVIGYVGSLSLASHAVDLLLDAFRRLLARHPNAVLLLVGGGEDGRAVQAIARRLGVHDACRFVGRVPAADVSAYYAVSDVTVDPVHDDAVARARCPLKIVESMALGVPVVTGDVGDRREMLADGRAGVLVAPGQAEALAAGLAAVLDDRQLATSLSRGALEQRQAFYWDDLARRVVALYERAGQAGGPVRSGCEEGAIEV